MLCGAALRGVVRAQREIVLEQILCNWHYWQGRVGWPKFIAHDEGVVIDYFLSIHFKWEQTFADGYAKSGH